MAELATSPITSAAPHTLWAKALPLDALIHQFTVGLDPIHDLHIYPYDCQASAAHARMLGKVGLLTEEEVTALTNALQQLYQQVRAGQAQITAQQEDCHTAIEFALTGMLGDVGKKIHCARSRNDQVLVATRLYLRDTAFALAEQVSALTQALLQFANQHAALPLPGYTHMRRAMPDRFDAWAWAYAEGLLEELQSWSGIYQRLDRCPLGAAAGFGTPIAIDRAYSTELLGFAKVQRSPADCMNSRGRHEQALLDFCVSVTSTLEKLLWDIALFSTEEYGFLRLPVAFTTGSSIMPNKRNPDVIELARGKCRELRGIVETHRQICTGLPGSYHRDFQLAKAPLFGGLNLTQSLLSSLTYLLPHLQVDAVRSMAACSEELFATKAAYQLVQQGVPFRDAYKQVAAQLANGSFQADRSEDIVNANAISVGIAQCADELALEHDRILTIKNALQAKLDLIWNRTI